MPYESIRITRERNSFSVQVTDPEIVKKNRANDKVDGPSEWQSPDQEYSFETKEAVLKFVESAIDIALPANDDYTSAFDKLAKEAGGTDTDDK